MFCRSCGTAAQSGQKFCTECGAMLPAVVASSPVVDSAPTPAAGLPLPPPTLAPPVVAPPVVGPSAAPAAADAPTVAVPPVAAVDQYGATSALSVVQQTSPTGYEPATWTGDTTGQWPAQGGDTGEQPTAHAFRITPLFVVSALAAVAAIGAAFVDVATFKVEGDFLDAQVFKLNDFASNLTIGAVIAVVLLVGGSALGATGRRIGAGLAGGAGLALAGMFGLVIGQVTALFDAEEVFLLGGGGTFTLTTTQEIGFWLAAVAAGLGVVAFVLSLTSAGRDGHPALNPLIGVVGALGTLAVVVGPLIPMNGASFGDNFSNDSLPPATLYLRLAVVVLIGIGGVVGFLVNRRWGIGLALGAISIGAWQWATAISESGDLPFGIAGGNLVPDIDDLYAPHIVTTIGVIVMLVAGVAGLLAAAQQRHAR